MRASALVRNTSGAVRASASGRKHRSGSSMRQAWPLARGQDRVSPRGIELQWAVVATLGIKLLGELVVERDGTPVALPPSRKTRALLGYLVLTGRAHRRDALCELFWDVT